MVQYGFVLAARFQDDASDEAIDPLRAVGVVAEHAREDSPKGRRQHAPSLDHERRWAAIDGRQQEITQDPSLFPVSMSELS